MMCQIQHKTNLLMAFYMHMIFINLMANEIKTE